MQYQHERKIVSRCFLAMEVSGWHFSLLVGRPSRQEEQPDVRTVSARRAA